MPRRGGHVIGDVLVVAARLQLDLEPKALMHRGRVLVAVLDRDDLVRIGRLSLTLT